MSSADDYGTLRWVLDAKIWDSHYPPEVEQIKSLLAEHDSRKGAVPKPTFYIVRYEVFRALNLNRGRWSASVSQKFLLLGDARAHQDTINRVYGEKARNVQVFKVETFETEIL